MALQPWTAPPGDPTGDEGALALVTTASGERVTAAEYEKRVKEVRKKGGIWAATARRLHKSEGA